jgi:Arc/MetJ-type ribon-helix-helix transcriptional regulator
MTLTLDPNTEQSLQQELAAGRYQDPAELIAHALELVRAERTGGQAVDQAMNDWLLRNRDAIDMALDESFAAKARGESYSPEEAEAILAERRAARISRAA